MFSLLSTAGIFCDYLLLTLPLSCLPSQDYINVQGHVMGTAGTKAGVRGEEIRGKVVPTCCQSFPVVRQEHCDTAAPWIAVFPPF